MCFLWRNFIECAVPLQVSFSDIVENSLIASFGLFCFVRLSSYLSQMYIGLAKKPEQYILTASMVNTSVFQAQVMTIFIEDLPCTYKAY